MAVSGISGSGAGYQGLSQLQGAVATQAQGQAQGAQQQTPAKPQADTQSFNIQGPSKPATGGSSATSASAAQPVSTGPARPGQAGAGIGDLQSVAPSSVSRGQIVDIAA